MSEDYTPNWLVEGLIEKSDLGLIFGSSGGGKSFVVLKMCYCIAAGIPFHGKNTKLGRVLYVYGEGYGGIQKRFGALREKHNGVLGGRLHLTRQSAALMDVKSAKAVRNTMDSLGGIDLVVIDTLHRNFGAGDENSSKDFAILLQNVDKFIKSSGETVIIIHHSGNDSNGRSRGSSSIRAAMDVEFEVIKSADDIVTMTNTKMKNFEPPMPMAFKFTPIAESVVLELTEFVKKPKVKPLSNNALIALRWMSTTVQTCRTIQETLSDTKIPPESAYVMIRIYQLAETEKEFIRDITYATNSQNPVDLRDLHSNDSLQKQLAAGIESLGYTYKRQREEGGGGSNVVTSSIVAESVLAIWRKKPHQAKFRRKEHFDKLYTEIFDNLNALQAVLALIIFRTVETQRKKLTSENSTNFLLYASHYISMLMGSNLLSEHGIKFDEISHRNFKDLLSTFETRHDEFYRNAIEKIERALVSCYGEREISLQQLSATFRRGDLLEMLAL